MKIVVTGASGLVGKVLVPTLESAGHSVVSLVRKKTSYPSQKFWDPEKNLLDPAIFEGVNAVIHLAGDPIADGRWTKEKKERIRKSRVIGTTLLAQTLAKLNTPPAVFVSASAIGYYGDRKDEVLQEESTLGTGFLPEVCQAWEEATKPARDKGIRTVNLRIGVILSGQGGALKKMLPPFQLGLGGVIGNGKQFMSWVSLADVVGIIQHALQNNSLQGAINTVSPQPVTNREFTKTLGRVLKRPTIFPMPALAAILAFGEMAKDLLLASTRVIPAQLMVSGYRFRHSDLEKALRDVLQDP